MVGLCADALFAPCFSCTYQSMLSRACSARPKVRGCLRHVCVARVERVCTAHRHTMARPDRALSEEKFAALAEEQRRAGTAMSEAMREGVDLPNVVTFAELALRNAHSDLKFELESRELARKRAREQQRERLRREYEKRAEERRWQVYEELHAWLMDLFDGAVPRVPQEEYNWIAEHWDCI